MFIYLKFCFVKERGIVCYWLDVSCNSDSDCNRCQESNYECHVIEDILTMAKVKRCSPSQDGDEY